MHLVATIKLKPTPEQTALLSATLERCNAACNALSAQAWKTQAFRQFDLHKLGYRAARQAYGLSAQTAVRCVAKVADAYKLDRKVQRVFRSTAAQPFDLHIFRFVNEDTISIWTLTGRQKIAFTCGEYQRRLLDFRKGQVALYCRRGKWYLAVNCDVPIETGVMPGDALGVDLGIVNIATDSDGRHYTGALVETVRSKLARRRAGLQKRGTKAAKRRLRKLSGKQRRFQTHTNHVISKALVETAQRSGRAIGLEDLTHIRTRVKARRGQRARLHNWSFGQLRSFIAYKAERVGIPVLFVDPRYTSKGCSMCGTIDDKNRPDQATFSCISCGHSESADLNAARNIRAKAAVNLPLCSQTAQAV